MDKRAKCVDRGFHITTLSEPRLVTDEVARRIIEAVRVRPTLTLGLPTGSTALPVYAALIESFRAGRVDFAKCQIFAVDEYLDLGPDDPRSYAYFLRQHLLRHIDFPMEQFHIPDGRTIDPDREAWLFAKRLSSHGGFDVLFLGLGRNGHLAFNEPGTLSDARTRPVRLDPTTLHANSRFFNAEVEQPTEAITIGLAEIMSARQVIVAATGSTKAPAVTALRGSEPVSLCPASILIDHPNACLIVDSEAAGSNETRRLRSG